MKKGFTLIELLVVVLIIGILASIAVPKYTLVIEKSKMTEGIIKVKSLLTATQRYYTTKGTYPRLLSELDIDFKDSEITSYHTTGDAMKSKNFVYLIDHSTNPPHVQALRNNRILYIIAYYKPGSDLDAELFCTIPVSLVNATEGKVCAALTGKTPVTCLEAGYLCYAL